MTKQELVELLKAGKIDEFNQFRADNPDFKIDFYGADFSGTDLSYANLAGVNLAGANFTNANLIKANLKNAELYGVKIDKQQLVHLIFLCGAEFNCADFFLDDFNEMLPKILGIKINGAGE